MVRAGKCDISITRNISNISNIVTAKCPAGHQYSLPKDRSFVTEVNMNCCYDVDELCSLCRFKYY